MASAPQADLNAADWQRLSALFDELAELPAPERDARLAALQPPELAARLRRMLASLPDDDGDAAVTPVPGFGAQLAQALAPEPAVPAAQPGDRFGAWCLAQLLGEGGMGQVWRAERADGLYQGEAAIKLLRGDLAGPGLATRFARERALLGRLTHPGIARLLDAGEQDGRAFLVLEYVDGRTLSEHVRAHGLGLAERVRLLVGVARAVEHAHAQLIVHRDLKPSNVMVDDHGAPKLLDFGIAGLLDDSGQQADSQLTQVTGRRLTPAYAAPEQILGGPIGVAADIYSLGVMLYELASGQLPLGRRGQSRTALEHAVLHGQARRITRALGQPDDDTDPGPGRPADARRAAGDLEAVVAKALRKNPAERYTSVRSFVDDLERWLAQRPVSVRAEDWRHRTRLWMRRNALLVGASTLVLGTLSAGLAVSLWQRQQAQAAAVQAELVTAYLGELLSAASPDQNRGRQPTVVELLDKKRHELARRFNDQPEVKDRVFDTLAKTYFALQRFGVAVSLAQERLDHARARFGPQDPRTDDAAFALAGIHSAVASGQPVIDLLEPLLPRWDRVHGPISEKTHQLRMHLMVAYARLGRFDDANRELALARRSNDAVNAGNPVERGRFESYAGTLLVNQGRLSEALQALERTRSLWNPQEARHLRPTLVLERNVAFVRWRMAAEDADAAERRSQALIQRWDGLAGVGNHGSTLIRQQLAAYYQQLGLFEPALQQLEQAQALTEAAGAEDDLTGQLRRIALLEARVQAQGHASPALIDAAQAALAALDRAPLIGDVRLADGLLTLGRVAIAPDGGPQARELALQISRRLDALKPVLRHAEQQGSRIALFQARLQGDPQSWLDATRRRVAYFDSLPERQGLPDWIARLQHACALQAQGAAGAAALADAERARPRGLDTAAAASHPLLRVAAELRQGRPVARDCDWRF